MSEKTIYIEVHDSIGDIVTELANAKSDELLLVVPRGAVLLQSLINFKLLKSQADQLGKTITLSTEGGLGENLAREAGLGIIETLKPTATQISTSEDTQSVDEPAEEETSFDAGDSGESADENEDDDDDDDDENDEDNDDSSDDPGEDEDEDDEKDGSSTLAIHHWQEFRRTKLDVLLGDDASSGQFSEDDEDDDTSNKRRLLPNLSWPKLSGLMRLPKLPAVRIRLQRQHLMAGWIILAGCAVFFAVGYFVLPKAYAAIEVQSEPYKKQFGFVVADENDLQAAGPNLVTGRYLEVVRENVVNFTATGEKNRGAKAEGKITIVNTTGTIQGLLANTRFQAANGLIFRTKFEILVPPARGNSAGRAVVDAVADDGGAKYNLPVGTRLSIPGLGPAGQDVVYGEITGAFSGGTDDIVKVVSEQDVNKAKEEAAKNVFATAEADLADNLKRGEEILPGFIQNDIIDALPSVSIGTEQANFDVRVQSRSWVLAVKKGALAAALANAASFEVPEGKQVTERTLANAKTEVVESNFLTHRINLVVTFDGRIGPRVETDEIGAAMANKPIAQAREYISSIPDTISGSIELWPSFLTRVPLLRNNIRVRVIYIGE